MSIVSRGIDWVATPYSIYLLLKSPDIPSKVKLKAALLLAALMFYILDPLDIIPDFIPFFGLLDDFIVIPLFLFLADKFIPEISVARVRNKARASVKRVMFWLIAAGLGVAAIVIALVGVLIFRAVNG